MSLDVSSWDTSPSGILRLIADGENDHVEFKLRLPPERLIARVISAFANTRGGILLIGVKEPGEVKGLTDDEAPLALHRLERICKSLLGIQDVRLGVAEIDGKKIVFIAVGEAPSYLRPVTTAEGEVFTRVGEDVRLEPVSSWSSSPTSASADVTVFIAMSFKTEEEPHLIDYYRAMERAAARAGVKLQRVDLIEGDYEISKKIMDEIDACDAVLADFTLSSRNVYFELGYARGKKKSIVQTARKETVLEFDIRNWKTHFYRNATELEEKLVPAFSALHD